MIIDLRRLEDARGRLESEEIVPFTDAFGEEREIACRVGISYERSGGAYFFHGDLTGELQTQCHVCLEAMSFPVAGEFDVVVRRGERQSAGGEETENLIIVSLNEHDVSFDRYIYENLIVNVPMKILCREDCKGLCPQCGVNRNVKACSCSDTGDSRWDALRKLKND